MRSEKIWQAGLTLVAVLGLFCQGCKPGLAWLVGAESIDEATLHERLDKPGRPQILDVRGESAFRKGHIPGAVSVPYDELESFLERVDLDCNRPVVAACVGGWLSLLAVPKIKGHGHAEVYSLANGMDGWNESGYMVQPGEPEALLSGAKPRLTMYSKFDQVVSAFSALGIKPAYMLLALLLAFMLRRKPSLDLRLLRWCLALFFAGEFACALNIVAGAGPVFVLSMLHNLGMVAMGMLFLWGLFEMLDKRVLNLTDPQTHCAFQRLCGPCWKQKDVSCGIHYMMVFLAPAFAVISLIPWTTSLQIRHINSEILGTQTTFAYPLDELILDFRIYPVLAALAFLVALVLLKGGARSLTRARIPFFVGLGFMTFSIFRYFLLETYRDAPIWDDFWEEATEFIFVAGLGLFLFVFRKQLGLFRRLDHS